MVEHEKIKNVQRSMTKGNQSAQQSSSQAGWAVPQAYSKVLYKMVSHQGAAFKDQFMAENGSLVLKQFLKDFYE